MYRQYVSPTLRDMGFSAAGSAGSSRAAERRNNPAHNLPLVLPRGQVAGEESKKPAPLLYY